MREDDYNRIIRNQEKLKQMSEKYKLLKYDLGLDGKEINDMPKQSNPFNTSMHTVDEAYEMETEYKNLYYENMLLINKIRAEINELPDLVLRMVLSLKYINGLKTYEIAPAVGITESECQMIIKVYFGNLF